MYKAELELIKTNPKVDLSSRDDRKRGAGERISYLNMGVASQRVGFNYLYSSEVHVFEGF